MKRGKDRKAVWIYRPLGPRFMYIYPANGAGRRDVSPASHHGLHNADIDSQDNKGEKEKRAVGRDYRTKMR